MLPSVRSCFRHAGRPPVSASAVHSSAGDSSVRTSHTASRTIAFVALLTLPLACSRPAPTRTVRVDEVHSSLLDEPDAIRIERGSAPADVRISVIEPSAGAESPEREGLPGLVLLPTSTATIALPERPAGARLAFATCIRRKHYRGQGDVRIVLFLDGEPVHDERVSASDELPPEERCWHPSEIELGAARVLTIEAIFEPTADFEARLAAQLDERRARREAGRAPDSEDGDDSRARAGEAERPASESDATSAAASDGGADDASDGDPLEPPAVGIGLLEVRIPNERPRWKSSADQPSVVLVLIDTLRADALGAYGNERVHSPELDRLAADGTLFERAFSSASWTSPSTASVLTSLPPPAHSLSFHSTHSPSVGTFLAEKLVTLPELFARAGFETAAFSCNPLVSATYNFDQGFSSFRTYRWTQAHAGVIDDALEWVRAHAAERFFLYLHLVDPHAPYVPEDDLPLEGSLDAGPSLEGLYDGTAKAAFLKSEMPLAELEALADKAHRMYLGEVASVDRQIGRLRAGLAELGLTDRTILALTSDHGEEFLDHGLIGHVYQLYEESVGIPLILAGPGVPRGRRVEAPVENRFIGQTLLRLADVAGDGAFEGFDLLSSEERDARRAPIFFTTRNAYVRRLAGERWMQCDNLHGVLDGDLLYFWSPPGPRFDRQYHALFDLATDPGALHDVFPDRRRDAARLRRSIEDWLRDGEARAPRLQEASEEKLELLRGLGYVDDE